MYSCRLCMLLLQPLIAICLLLSILSQLLVKISFVPHALDTSETSDPFSHPPPKLFESKPLIIWNTDAHHAPAADIRELVEPMGVRVLQHLLSNPFHCRRKDLCENSKTLKVLSVKNFQMADSAELKSAFYAAYKDDPVMKSVDAFLCTDVVATCQLYMQFNKTIILVATTRYYVYRENLQTWNRWNADLKRIAADPRNVIAANSIYDVRFMRFFTGIEPIYIPSYCGYTNATYNSTKPVYLLARNRLSVLEPWLEKTFNEIRQSKNCQVVLQRIYGPYRYSDLTSYRGIVHIPYQVSTMSIFEQYRMNIPLFFPSKNLLIRWDMKFFLLKERTRPPYVRHPPRFPSDPSEKHLPSPSDNRHAAALDYWLQFADYYTMPFIQYFDSVEHLGEMLCRMTEQDLKTISERMRQYNVESKENLTAQWKEIMLKVATQSPNHRKYATTLS